MERIAAVIVREEEAGPGRAICSTKDAGVNIQT